MTYEFTIPATPISKKNHRPIFYNKKTGKRFIGKSKALADFEKIALLTLKSQKSIQEIREPLSNRLEIHYSFFFEKSCRADWDNLVCAPQDLLVEAGIIKDDHLIKEAHCYISEHTGRKDKIIIHIKDHSTENKG